VPAVKSDGGWIPEFRERYAAWLPEALPLLERHEYARAFSSYPWPAVGESPWAPLRKPLAECRVALVTTAGLYRPGVDAPFAGPAPEGDWTYRAIPVPEGTPVLAIAHEHFPHEPALSDLDTVLPLERLRELVREGIVGAVAPVVWSLMGYCTRAADLAEETAPAIAQGLRDQDADLALVVPV
jgi:D-proline reductase (dithiol) PrdB